MISSYDMSWVTTRCIKDLYFLISIISVEIFIGIKFWSYYEITKLQRINFLPIMFFALFILKDINNMINSVSNFY